jgi:hypothetical protein
VQGLFSKRPWPKGYRALRAIQIESNVHSTTREGVSRCSNLGRPTRIQWPHTLLLSYFTIAQLPSGSSGGDSQSAAATSLVFKRSGDPGSILVNSSQKMERRCRRTLREGSILVTNAVIVRPQRLAAPRQ